MNSPLSRLHPAKARPAERGMPHVQGYQDSQANPDSSARRLSSSLHPPHLASSPIQFAYHQKCSPPESFRGGLSQGPGYALNVAFMDVHLPILESLPYTFTPAKPYRAYLSQASHPVHSNRVHALSRRERTVSAIHGSIRSSGLSGA